MKKITAILSTLLICITAYNQTELTNKYDITAEKIAVDNLGYIYTVNATQLCKFDKDFNKIGQYDDKSHGEISSVDCSDPFRILIFYKDFNKIVFLDNYLAELRDAVLLDDLMIYSTDAVCSSTQGSFRVFDNQNSAVNSYNKDLNIIQTGVNLYSVSGDQTAIKIKESNNFVYVLFNSGEIVILDKFSNFVKKPEWQNVKSFDCIDDKLFVLIDSEIFFSNENYELVRFYSHESDQIIDFAISINNLFVLTEKSLITFKIL